MPIPLPLPQHFHFHQAAKNHQQGHCQRQLQKLEIKKFKFNDQFQCHTQIRHKDKPIKKIPHKNKIFSPKASIIET